ncbi:MAG: tyrosine-type recombinase/integrase [Pseudonocardiaceae bacterium]
MSDPRAVLADYLEVRRALGYKLVDDARLLGDFVAYLEQTGAVTVTVEAALAWATRPADAGPAWWSHRLRVVRGFAKHLSALDGRAEVPPVGLLPARVPRAQPYLYSDTDIAALMAAARELRSPLRAATYETLVGLLAVTGLRIGEAIGLDRDDVDLGAGLATIRHGKHGKSRLVVCHPSTVEALGAYQRLADKLCSSPTAPSFFISTVGTRLIYKNGVLCSFCRW